MNKKQSPYSGRTPNEGHKKGASAEPGKGERKYTKPGKFIKSDKTTKPFEKKERPFRQGKESDSNKPFKYKSKSNDRDKPFDKDRKPGEFKKPFDRSEKPFRKNERSFDKSDKPFGKRENKPFDKDRKPGEFKKTFDRSEKPFKKNERSFDRSDKPFGKRENRPSDKERRPDFKKTFGSERKPKFIKPEAENPFDKPFPLGTRKVSGPFRKKFNTEQENKPRGEKPNKAKRVEESEVKEMTLNKYIAHSGECSRRDAAALVKQGKVKVNGELMLDPGYRVKPEDHVVIAGKKLKPVRDLVYILLNKPKDFITTTDDPQGRKTVMDLVENAGVPRLYPVGRLDRETTGLLLLTNDGDLAQKLSHPSYEIKKVYQVTLNKPLTKADFEKILAGVELEDGAVKVDALSYLEEKNELGIEIHSGRNRVVRRIFESLGYEVEKLDRVMYAGLTKKNLPRSKWRFLDEREVILLKHFKN